MSIGKLGYIRLCVSNYNDTLAFYRDHLGCQIYSASPGNQSAELGLDNVTIMLTSRDVLSQILPDLPSCTQQFNQMLSISVSDIDAVHQQLQHRNVDFVLPPTDRPTHRLRNAYLRDPEGNLIELYTKWTRTR